MCETYQQIEQERNKLRRELTTLKEAVKSVLEWEYMKLVTEDHIDGDGLCRSLDALAALAGEEGDV